MYSVCICAHIKTYKWTDFGICCWVCRPIFQYFVLQYAFTKWMGSQILSLYLLVRSLSQICASSFLLFSDPAMGYKTSGSSHCVCVHPESALDVLRVCVSVRVSVC